MSIDAKQDVGVLVAGAGPTGLTLVCELLRRGVSGRIIDKAPAPATTSRALGLQPRTLELFDRMGVVDEVLATDGPMIDANLYDGHRLLLTISAVGARSLDTPYPRLWITPQTSVEAPLLSRLHALGGYCRLRDVPRGHQPFTGATRHALWPVAFRRAGPHGVGLREPRDAGTPGRETAAQRNPGPPHRRRGRGPREARPERFRLAGRVRYAARALWRPRGSALSRLPRWLRRPPRTAGGGRPAARIPRTPVPAGASLIAKIVVVGLVRGPDEPSHRGPERWRSRRRRGTIDAKGARVNRQQIPTGGRPTRGARA